MWENINSGDFINCGRLSSLLWVVLNAICLEDLVQTSDLTDGKHVGRLSKECFFQFALMDDE